MTEHRDIVVTWPKRRPFGSYMAELALARRDGLVVNYRVSRLPSWEDAVLGHHQMGWPPGVSLPRCYMVHDGFVRGYLKILYTCWRREGEVRDWPAGLYIVRDPLWHPIEPIPMHGFRGWRWYVP